MTYYGVGVHGQNEVAEMGIRIIVGSDSTMVLHQYLV